MKNTRTSADQHIVNQNAIVPSRTRSAFSHTNEFIYSPIESYRIMADSIESQIEKFSLVVTGFCVNYTATQGWQLTYQDTYDKHCKTIVELEKAAPGNQTLAQIKEQLNTAKEEMDNQVEDTQIPSAQSPPLPSSTSTSETSSPAAPRPQVNSHVAGIRLRSETADNFLDINAESEMLTSLQQLGRNQLSLDKISKLASSTANLVSSQQQALRAFKSDISLLCSSVNQQDSRLNDRLANIEKSVVNLQTSVNTQTMYYMDLNKDVANKFKAINDKINSLETNFSAQTPPPTSQGHPEATIGEPQPSVALSQQENARSQRTVPIVLNSTTASTAGIDTLRVLSENRIKDLINQMRETLAITIDDDSSDALIQECQLKKIPILKSDMKDLNKYLAEYLEKYTIYDENLIEESDVVLRDCQAWMTPVNKRYNTEEIFRVPSSGKEPLINLEKFNPDGEVHIFEFLSKFECRFRGLGSNTEKSEKLWTDYLPDQVKVKSEPHKSNLKDLKHFLIKKYGNLSHILETSLKNIEKFSKKSTSQFSSRLAFFTKVLLILHKLEESKNFVPSSSLSWENSVYSVTTMNRLIDCMSSTEWEFLSNKLTEQGLDTDEIQGKPSFESFKTTCQYYINFLSRQASKETTPTCNSVLTSGPTETQRKGKKFSKPCPLPSHSHLLADCKEFWSLSPPERRAAGNTALCIKCLGPQEDCKKKCRYRIPRQLLCKQCKFDTGFPVNILVCSKGHMNEISGKKLFSSVKVLVPGVNESWFIEKYTANSSTQSSTTGNDKETVTTFNTQNGKQVNNAAVEKEKELPSALLSQWIKIGKKSYLIFFDSGASSSLISSKLAKEANIEQISGYSSNLSVVGGAELPTYGTYRIALGPTAKNEFFELLATSLDRVTVDLPEFSVEQIKRELFNFNPKFKEKLPSKIGGGPVSLLVGMRDPKIQPTLLYTLPSGIGVYESQFRDQYGSNIIFAGSHPSFDVSKRQSKNIVLFFNQMSDIRTQRPDAEDMLPEIFPNHMHQGKHQPSPPTIAGKVSSLPQSRKEQLARVTDLDKDPLINFRCKDCKECSVCKQSTRMRSVSQIELIEQQVIEESVTIDRKEKKVKVKLPFMKNPVTFFKEKFQKFKKYKGKPSNYTQALKRYVSQCRKPEHIKEGIRKVFRDLLERGYVIELSKSDKETQQVIKNADVLHFYNWNAVIKEDSLSTPVRMVVDPSCTGLNECLAKGENRLGRIDDIVIRNRGRKFIFSTDISKMYNVLHLDSSAYPYSLILFDETLDPDTEPKIYLMLRAWYGTTPTGNQAAFAIRQLTKLPEDEEQLKEAIMALIEDIYVDDVESGADTEELRDKIITDLKSILDSGGFFTKFVCKSGETPCDKASSDGKVVKLLGYDWRPLEDTLALSFSDLNFFQKKKGKKPPLNEPITSEQGLKESLSQVTLTKKSILSKIASIYDPIGFWEPLRLQLKLHFSRLNEKSWNETIGGEEEIIWKEIFSQFFHLPSLRVDRYFLPKEISVQTPVRIIGLSDAAEKAGGAVIYAGVPQPDGSYSCQIVTAKSRLLSETIPRNELLAIVLLAELMHQVILSLRCPIGEILYVTDSTIALAWCRSTTKKLKVFVANRVSAILTYISWAVNDRENKIPLYHIEGKQNIADRLTKPEPFQVSSVAHDSEWIKGKPWMTLPTEKMELDSFEKVRVEKEKLDAYREACIDDPHFLKEKNNPELVDTIPVFTTLSKSHQQFLLIDLVFFGWKKSIRILANVFKFVHRLKHKKHGNNSECPQCFYNCDPDFEKTAELYIFRKESMQIEKELQASKLAKYRKKDGVLYYDNRMKDENPITGQDLEFDVFFDHKDSSSSTYVVRPKSPVFFSYLLFVHLHVVPHSGNVRTERYLLNKIHPVGKFRHIISKVRNDCSTCILLNDRTVKVKMGNFPKEKSVIAPPFSIVQCDIVYGFLGRPFTHARTKVKLYALILVCINTSATSILCIESLSTQEVINAIIRHSNRYGLPSTMIVDNGTQLAALKSAEFSLRDVNAFLHDSKGINIMVTRPKSHSDNGKCEVRVRLLREMIKKLNLTSLPPLTQLQFETVFSSIANDLNNLPIARTDSSSARSRKFELITPNRLLLGRNNFRSLSLDIKLCEPTLPSKILENNAKIFAVYMQTLIEHLHYFLGSPPGKWEYSDDRQPLTGDIVSFIFNDGVIPVWKIGRVINVEGSNVEIDYVNVTKDTSQSKSVIRSPRDLKIIFSEGDFALNSQKYFSEIIYSLSFFQGGSHERRCQASRGIHEKV